MAARFKKGDTVIVIAGKDKGKTGEITQVLPKEEKVIVAGINIARVHKKPTASTPGQISKVEKPIHISNVSHIEDNKPVKVKFVIENEKKVRVSRKTGKKVGE